MALTIELEEGSHTIEYRKTDYETVSFTITVVAGQPETYTKSLNPKPGSISVSANVANATATIVETGESCTTTCTFNNISPGTYTIRCEKSGYLTDEKTVDLSANEDASVSFTLEEKTLSFTFDSCSLEISEGKPGTTFYADAVYTNEAGSNITVTPHIKIEFGNEVLYDADEASIDPNTGKSNRIYNLTVPDKPSGDYTVTFTLSVNEQGVSWSDTCTKTFTIPKEAAQITFESSPSGADVYVDGNHVGTT